MTKKGRLRRKYYRIIIKDFSKNPEHFRDTSAMKNCAWTVAMLEVGSSCRNKRTGLK